MVCKSKNKANRQYQSIDSVLNQHSLSQDAITPQNESLYRLVRKQEGGV